MARIVTGIVVLIGIALSIGQCVTARQRAGPDPYDACVSAGEAFFVEQAMSPVMPDGRETARVVRERCMRNSAAFG